MAPSAVNDGGRALQAEVAKLVKDVDGTLTTAGSSTAYTLTLTTTPSALADGLFFSATIDETNAGGATTLVVTPAGGSAFASKKIKVFQNGVESDPTVASMIANGHYLFQYDSAADSATGAYILLNPDSAGTVLLLSGTVSAAATLDLALPTGFKSIRILLDGVIPATSATFCGLRVSVDNGSSYVSSAGAYKYAMRGLTEGSASGDTASASSTQIQLTTTMPNSGTTPATIEVTIPNYSNGTLLKPMLINTASYNSASSIWICQNGMGIYASAVTAITHVRFVMATGNITAANYRVYGER